MRFRRVCAVVTPFALLALSSCASPRETVAPIETVAPVIGAEIVPGLRSLPITAEALTGDWARTMPALRDKGHHYWLRLSRDGTFALTVNREQYEERVNQKGTYSLEGDQIIFTAEAGSLECEGSTATYRLILVAESDLFEPGDLLFEPIDVPCTEWLNMGWGNLGEATMWVPLDQ